MTCRAFTLALIAAAMAFLPGCQTLKPNWQLPKWLGGETKEEKPQYGVPVKMAAIWSPAVYNEAGKPPTRGLGGRIYFYNANNNPIAVDGQLVVYAYDDSVPKQDTNTPDRKYVFTAEQFTQHLKPTELGASYSVWLPWDEAGKPQAEVSLVPIFTAANGQLTIGQSSRNTLPGPKTPPPQSKVSQFMLPQPVISSAPGAQSPQPQFAGQQVAYQQRADGPAPANAPPGQAVVTSPSGGLETMSINLPGTMADRLQQAPPQTSVSPTSPWQQTAKSFTTWQAGAQPMPGAARVSQAAAPAAIPAWPPAVPQPARFEPAKPLAPIAPAFQPTGGPTPTQPSLVGWPSSPPAPPLPAPPGT